MFLKVILTLALTMAILVVYEFLEERSRIVAFAFLVLVSIMLVNIKF